MVQHPTEDYLEFEETYGEGMRRAKRLLAFLSEDVVGALLCVLSLASCSSSSPLHTGETRLI